MSFPNAAEHVSERNSPSVGVAHSLKSATFPPFCLVPHIPDFFFFSFYFTRLTAAAAAALRAQTAAPAGQPHSGALPTKR